MSVWMETLTAFAAPAGGGILLVSARQEGRQLLSACARTVRIPMREHCESLNAAIAAAVLLWEAARDD